MDDKFKKPDLLNTKKPDDLDTVSVSSSLELGPMSIVQANRGLESSNLDVDLSVLEPASVVVQEQSLGFDPLDQVTTSLSGVPTVPEVSIPQSVQNSIQTNFDDINQLVPMQNMQLQPNWPNVDPEIDVVDESNHSQPKFPNKERRKFC